MNPESRPHDTEPVEQPARSWFPGPRMSRLIHAFLLVSLLLAGVVPILISRFRYGDRMWTSTWNMSGDLMKVKQGDWVESEWEWSQGKSFARGVSRMACVRATAEEVWIEVSSEVSSGFVDLLRVDRKTREVKAAWQMRPGRSPIPLPIYRGAPPDLGPPPPFAGTVSDAAGDSEEISQDVCGRSMKVEKSTFACRVEGNLRPVEKYAAEIVLSDDVPFPVPVGGDQRRTEPEHVIALCASGIPWKRTPGLSGGVVRFEITKVRPASGGARETREVRRESLRAFGHDAKPIVIVKGETDR